jgi:uncharacterized membrane protein
MSELVVLVYPGDSIAPAVVDRLERLAQELAIDIEDMVFVTRSASGSSKVHHPLAKTGAAATVGGVCGALAGFLVLNPVGGAVVGAGAGAALSRLSTTGIDRSFVRTLSDELQPGTSAVFVLVRSVDREAVLPEVARFGGRVLYTSLSPEAEAGLRQALDDGRPASQDAPG